MTVHARRRTARSFDSAVALRLPRIGRLVWTQSVVAALVAAAVVAGLPTAAVIWSAAASALLPFVVVAGREVVDWFATAARYASHRMPDIGVTTDQSWSDGRSFGVHWRPGRVTCVLELQPATAAVTTLGRSEANTDVALDLARLAECLSQHDITLSGIDVVAHGLRTASGTPATDVYERLIGPLPAVASRTVWVAVSLDLASNRAAIDARGGGGTGAALTVAIATERVSRALTAARITSRMLTRPEITAATSQLLRGVSTDRLTESWTAAPLPGVKSEGYGFDCRKIDNAVLTELWALPSLSTTVVVRLTPGSAVDRVRVSGECRFVTRSTRPEPRLPGAVSMNGRHREALLTTLPLGITAPGHSQPVRELDYSRLSELRLPVSGCGQLLGSNASGHGVAMRVHGRDIGTVLVAGELYLAQQLVFRAVATGARVLVRTDRPHAWGPLADSVATPDRLHLDGGPLRAEARFDMIVEDFADASFTAPRQRTDRTTTLLLTEHLPRTPMPDPDLTLVQPGAAGDRLLVRAGAHETSVVLVTISQETAFIGRPRSVRVPTAAGQPG
ncbi:type VII secretion protein EccE [Rhodococcoides yunnanense]|uniref:type VII secretion protein EccE n=1 Tax=Rhodococcoides yunnanense TaxID=278209 RepID=UPI000933D6EA|nr:type VII secretion protein EccE [Rhodococcus yunnanensis]